MDARSTGLVIVIAGLIVIGGGLLMMTGALGWFGRLPGDIRYSSGGTRIYVPITTMIVVSVVLSLVSIFIRRLL